VSSPNGDRGRNASPPEGGRNRSYTFGPFAAEAVSRERKASKVAKDMDGKGLDVRSVGEWEVKRWSSLVATEAAKEQAKGQRTVTGKGNRRPKGESGKRQDRGRRRLSTESREQSGSVVMGLLVHKLSMIL